MTGTVHNFILLYRLMMVCMRSQNRL